MPAEPSVMTGWPRSGWVRAVVVLGVAGIALGFGVAAVKVESHYAQLGRTQDLSPVAAVLADGSSPRTVWVGWAAALLFALSTGRVLHGPPEPPAGVDASTSATTMRAALRRELGLVSTGLLVVTLLTALELGRAAVTVAEAARTAGVARDRYGWVLVEAGGMVAACIVLAAWCVSFRRQCRNLGAL